MNHLHCMCAVAAVLVSGLSSTAVAQPGPAASDERTFAVFLRARPVGQETVSVTQTADGWVVRGNNRLGPPFDVVTRVAEIHYNAQWQPSRLVLEGTAQGQQASIKTTFENGEARSEIVNGMQTSSKTDKVSADAVVLPNAFLGSYAALTRRLVGEKPGALYRGYIAPQGEIPIRVDGTFAERIETPKETIEATRYALMVPNAALGGEMQVSVWADPAGRLLRLSVPAQGLEVAREDIASAATRTTSFSIPGDEPIRIPASGFSLAASVAKPAAAKGPLPAVVLVPNSTALDRDGTVGGVPVLGQIAAALVDAGFLVVRYDRRGVGQSGGRAENATINDYAEDVRAVLEWLEERRDDVDDDRIGLIGHGDGAWIAMRAAERDGRVAALALIGAVSTTGAEFTLEQQQDLLSRLQAPEEERKAKIDLQQRINAAALKGSGWETIPDDVRAAADTPWFQSFLSFDPARVIEDLREPILVVHGEADTQVATSHADRLAAMARGRRRKAETEIAKVPAANHGLVAADAADRVSPAALKAITTWMARVLG